LFQKVERRYSREGLFAGGAAPGGLIEMNSLGVLGDDRLYQADNEIVKATFHFLLEAGGPGVNGASGA
jgi:hypothetical protein